MSARTVLRNVPVPKPYLAALTCGELLHRIRPLPLGGARSLRLAFGGVLVSCSVALIGWALRATHNVDLEHPDHLVTTGPYARMRNPMYVAWALLATGVAVLRNSGWLLVSVPVAAALVHRDVLKEERELAALAPEAFRRYTAAVPRYLPRLKELR
jgi:protein-S-isoprenylcysteine O-methyltransferase Ste14